MQDLQEESNLSLMGKQKEIQDLTEIITQLK
jgi:hypothetical protein